MTLLLFMMWFITLIIFVIFWWNKRKARKAAGDNYINDKNYKTISLQKRIIGIICICSFLGMFVVAPSSDNKAATKSDRDISQTQEQINVDETKKDNVEKEKVEQAQETQKENNIDNGTLDAKRVKQYSLNRNLKDFEKKFTDKKYSYADFNKVDEWKNKYGQVIKIQLRQAPEIGNIYLYEYVNESEEMYAALLKFDASEALYVDIDDSLIWDFMYSVQPKFGTLEVREFAGDLKNNKKLSKQNIIYYYFENEGSGFLVKTRNQYYLATNEKLIPKEINSMNDFTEAVGLYE